MKKKLNPDQLKEKQTKEATKIKKKVASSLEWMDIDSIHDHQIILKKGNSQAFIRGIKIVPKNLFIGNYSVQIRALNQLRTIFNQLRFPLYWAMPHNPVNLDAHLNDLSSCLENEEDPVVKTMIQDDFEKAAWFQATHCEIEFFIMVKDNDEEECYLKYRNLVNQFLNSGLYFSELDDMDFENYLAYIYENPMINDFYFSHGIFECLIQFQKTAGETFEPKFELEDIPGKLPGHDRRNDYGME